MIILDIDFLELVKEGSEHRHGKWHNHVEAWLKNPYDTRMLIIKYEDLKMNTLNELKRFCSFVGVERDDSFLCTVADNASFEKMREKEINAESSNNKWPSDKLFARRGIVGSYKDEMPREVLEAFMAESSETIKKCGYM